MKRGNLPKRGKQVKLDLLALQIILNCLRKLEEKLEQIKILLAEVDNVTDKEKYQNEISSLDPEIEQLKYDIEMEIIYAI